MPEECSVCSATEDLTVDEFGISICSDCLFERETTKVDEDDMDAEDFEDF